MLNPIFTIRDKVSENCGNIFTCNTVAEAERQFFDAILNAVPGSLFKSHPEDFFLIKIGDFNTETASIENIASVEPRSR